MRENSSIPDSISQRRHFQAIREDLLSAKAGFKGPLLALFCLPFYQPGHLDFMSTGMDTLDATVKSKSDSVSANHACRTAHAWSIQKHTVATA